MFTKSTTMIKHIQNFRGVENKEKHLIVTTCGTSKLQANRLHEALLDHHKKKNHTFFRLFQYLFCQYKILYLVHSIFFSNLQFFFKLKKPKIGLAANFARWKKIGQKSIIFQRFYHNKQIFRTRVMKLSDFIVFLGCSI